MEYSKDVMPDGTVYESYEGTPEDIAKLARLLQHNDSYEVRVYRNEFGEEIFERC